MSILHPEEGLKFPGGLGGYCGTVHVKGMNRHVHQLILLNSSQEYSSRRLCLFRVG